jgi:ribosomal protein S21
MQVSVRDNNVDQAREKAEAIRRARKLARKKAQREGQI